ncbi:hypothetical protein ES705_43912 [subsurface metagenome]
MAYEIITIAFDKENKIFSAEDLNRFCINKRVLSKKIEFFQDGESSYWTILLEYESVLEPSGKETGGLTPAQKVCYEKLREWRKETAGKAGIPPFVIAKNSQLVEIISKEVTTLEYLKQINGFGKKKIDKYGKEITGIIIDFFKKPYER